MIKTGEIIYGEVTKMVNAIVWNMTLLIILSIKFGGLAEVVNAAD